VEALLWLRAVFHRLRHGFDHFQRLASSGRVLTGVFVRERTPVAKVQMPNMDWQNLAEIFWMLEWVLCKLPTAKVARFIRPIS